MITLDYGDTLAIVCVSFLGGFLFRSVVGVLISLRVRTAKHHPTSRPPRGRPKAPPRPKNRKLSEMGGTGGMVLLDYPERICSVCNKERTQVVKSVPGKYICFDCLSPN